MLINQEMMQQERAQNMQMLLEKRKSAPAEISELGN